MGRVESGFFIPDLSQHQLNTKPSMCAAMYTQGKTPDARKRNSFTALHKPGTVNFCRQRWSCILQLGVFLSEKILLN